ncbi:MAG: ankyrin repeat domain-containing protein, partial [Synergistaceae bacterium]|nr:ankyrin repeat domain-containing protein [Synergistaceae bacterium]
MKKIFCVIALLVFSLTGVFEALELGNDGAGFAVAKAEAARKKKKTTGTTKKSNQAKMKLTQKDYNEFVRICKSGNLQRFRSKLEGENISPNAMYYGSEGGNETLLTIAIAPEYTSGANNVEIIRFLLAKGADVNKKVAFY